MKAVKSISRSSAIFGFGGRVGYPDHYRATTGPPGKQVATLRDVVKVTCEAHILALRVRSLVPLYSVGVIKLGCHWPSNTVTWCIILAPRLRTRRQGQSKEVYIVQTRLRAGL